MSLRLPHMVLAIASLAALGACQNPDVGQPCTIAWGSLESSPPPDPVKLYNDGGADFFESGNVTCENLVCIVSPQPAGARYASGGYCSKPCVSDEDCFKSDTGLVCRQIILDPLFLGQLDQTPEGRALKEQYLGETGFSSFCAVPSP